MNKKISFIIPAYNSSKTISNCILSLLSYKGDKEIIVIDDGSTDQTQKIVANYVEKYDCVKYFWKENSGVSATRNFGIDVSSGDYLIFVDSDDQMIFGNFIININYQNCLVIFGFKKNNNGRISKFNYWKIKNGYFKKNNFLKKYYFSRRYFYITNYIFGRLFIRKIIQNNKIYFNEKIHFGEDTLFLSEYIKHIKNIYIQNEYTYLYNININSLSSKMKTSNDEYLDLIKKVYFNIGIETKLSEKFLLNNCLYSSYIFNENNSNYFDDIPFVKKYKFITNYQKNPEKVLGKYIKRKNSSINLSKIKLKIKELLKEKKSIYGNRNYNNYRQ